MKEQNQQELMFKLSIFEQQIRQLQQQIQAVEQGIVEISSLKLSLNDLKGAKGKEIMAPIGRGIFAKANLVSEDLVVDVGGGNFVKKSIEETKELIQNQIVKLEDVKKELEDNLEKVGQELEKVMRDGNHPCGENCKCKENGKEKCDDECECEKDRKD